MRISQIPVIVLALIALSLPACQKEEGQSESGHHKIVLTSPMVEDVDIAQPYVCQIRSKRHIEVRAMQSGYLEKIDIKEGDAVKAGKVLFQVVPILYKAKLDAELAEARLAKLELKYAETLAKQKVVSKNEVPLYKAKLARAEAKVKLAEAELDFTKVTAQFDGIVDRLQQQQGSLVKERDVLTTLSDNSVMWVYFNVPEARYLEYMAGMEYDLLLMFAVNEVENIPTKGKSRIIVADVKNVLHFRIFDSAGHKVVDTDEVKLLIPTGQLKTFRDRLAKLRPPHKLSLSEKQQVIAAATSIVGYTNAVQEYLTTLLTKGGAKIELVLASGNEFRHAALAVRSEGQFNNETGNIAFRADFENPERLLRHGMTGTVKIHRLLEKAIVIPQRATFEILDKQYVCVVGKDGKVHQRRIVVQNELENKFVIEPYVYVVGKDGKVREKGVRVDERIVYEGAQQVHEGEKVEEFEFRPPEEVLKNQQYHAE